MGLFQRKIREVRIKVDSITVMMATRGCEFINAVNASLCFPDSIYTVSISRH